MIEATNGLPEPITPNGHKAKVEYDRSRVVCMECPWFKYDPEADQDTLASWGRNHRAATRER